MAGEVCKLRDDAATVLACAVDTFDDSVSNVQCRISQKLADCLEPDVTFIVKYGAVTLCGREGFGDERWFQEQSVVSMRWA